VVTSHKDQSNLERCNSSIPKSLGVIVDVVAPDLAWPNHYRQHSGVVYPFTVGRSWILQRWTKAKSSFLMLAICTPSKSFRSLGMESCDYRFRVRSGMAKQYLPVVSIALIRARLLIQNSSDRVARSCSIAEEAHDFKR
jgi:hypothetical protein